MRHDCEERDDVQGRTILVTGGHGFLGRSVCRKLVDAGARKVVAPRRAEADLTEPGTAERLVGAERPDTVVHLAAEVGGIGANREHPGRFLFANLTMGAQLIEAARRFGVGRFVQVGTVCAYPKHTPVPFREEDLWNGYPEETNAPYGIAKKTLLVMLDAYREEYGFNGVYLLPANLYGPGDNFDPRSSHVIPALIRKFEEALRSGSDVVTCWGTGQASREFLYVDDCAEGIVSATRRYAGTYPVNLGSGVEVTIRDLAERIARLMGFGGRIEWDSSQPDGQPRRKLDVSRAARHFGFRSRIGLEEGLERTIRWYRGECQPPMTPSR